MIAWKRGRSWALKVSGVATGGFVLKTVRAGEVRAPIGEIDSSWDWHVSPSKRRCSRVSHREVAFMA